MANEKEKDIHPGAYEKDAGTYMFILNMFILI